MTDQGFRLQASEHLRARCADASLSSTSRCRNDEHYLQQLTASLLGGRGVDIHTRQTPWCRTECRSLFRRCAWIVDRFSEEHWRVPPLSRSRRSSRARRSDSRRRRPPRSHGRVRPAVPHTGPGDRLAVDRFARRFQVLDLRVDYRVIGITPFLGRLISGADVPSAGAPSPVVVLSHRFWQRQFGGDPRALGQTLRVEGVPLTIIGVTPPRFSGLQVAVAPDITGPITLLPQLPEGADGSTSWRCGWRSAPPGRAWRSRS